MTLEERLEEIYQQLTLLRGLQTPYLMTPQEEADLVHAMEAAVPALWADMEEGQVAAEEPETAAQAKDNEQIATREWYTKAKVRILETVRCGNPEGYECTFHAGQELPMVQWGRAGRPVDRLHWWNNFDIDGAFIIEASKVEVIEVLEEVSPA